MILQAADDKEAKDLEQEEYKGSVWKFYISTRNVSLNLRPLYQISRIFMVK